MQKRIQLVFCKNHLNINLLFKCKKYKMPNYLIEDNINFYEELNKSLNIDKEDSSEEKYCLITHELLLDDHVL